LTKTRQKDIEINQFAQGENMNNAILVLEDGTTFEGVSCGAPGEVCGEVVFHTGVVGYQEILTTPSCRGLLVALTYPLIGNYGTNTQDWESPTVHPRGLIIKELSPISSNFRAERNLADFMRENKLVAMEGIDTRALAVYLRDHGEKKGIVSTREFDVAKLQKKLKSTPSPYEEELLSQTTPQKTVLPREKKKISVAVMDFGLTRSTADQFAALDCSLIRFPAHAKAAEILETKPRGVLLSQGPGDPNREAAIVEEVKKLISGGLPILGIGLGHQFLGMALGAKAKRMLLGHRSDNQPVRESGQRRSLITSQSHSFVLEVSGDGDCRVTHLNINDQTVEGIASKTNPKVFSVQFIPQWEDIDKPNPVLGKFVRQLP
jgi:carbamoyl-phosphate synthase small subunit